MSMSFLHVHGAVNLGAPVNVLMSHAPQNVDLPPQNGAEIRNRTRLKIATRPGKLLHTERSTMLSMGISHETGNL